MPADPIMPGIYNDPIVIVAGLYLGFTYSDIDGDGKNELVSRTGHYIHTIAYA